MCRVGCFSFFFLLLLFNIHYFRISYCQLIMALADLEGSRPVIKYMYDVVKKIHVPLSNRLCHNPSHIFFWG